MVLITHNIVVCVYTLVVACKMSAV